MSQSQQQFPETFSSFSGDVEGSPDGGDNVGLSEPSSKWTSINIARIIEEKAGMKWLFITGHVIIYTTKNIIENVSLLAYKCMTLFHTSQTMVHLVYTWVTCS